MITTVFLYQEGKNDVSANALWQHETGRRLLRAAMEQLNIAGSLGYETGKPVFSPPNGYFFSISHCKNCVAVGLAETPVGIDIEGRRSVRENIYGKVLSAKELMQVQSAEEPDMAFLRFWTLKESYGKAFGRGIGYPMKEIEFSFDRDGKTSEENRGKETEEPFAVSCSDKGVTCCQWNIGDWVISLCERGEMLRFPRLIHIHDIGMSDKV